MNNKPFPFGPLSNTSAIQQQISEGEESDIDITDMGTALSNPGKKEDVVSLAAISSTAVAEHKGGPRVNEVVELMIEMQALKEVARVSDFPERVTPDTAYLTLQGIENSQQASGIKRRLQIWIVSSGQQFDKSMAPTMIHLFPQSDLAGNRATYATALVRFENIKTLQVVCDSLLIKPLENEDKATIKVGIAYDSRCTGESKWVGVVVRNLPADA